MARKSTRKSTIPPASERGDASEQGDDAASEGDASEGGDADLSTKLVNTKNGTYTAYGVVLKACVENFQAHTFTVAQMEALWPDSSGRARRLSDMVTRFKLMDRVAIGHYRVSEFGLKMAQTMPLEAAPSAPSPGKRKERSNAGFVPAHIMEKSKAADAARAARKAAQNKYFEVVRKIVDNDAMKATLAADKERLIREYEAAVAADKAAQKAYDEEEV